jgi:GNAT superfamily N-acetyltransferase
LSAFSRPRPIDLDQGLEGFDCGVPSLNEWLVNRAVRNEQTGVSRTFVTVSDDTGAVAGYYCLASGAIDPAAAPGRLRRNMPTPIPFILLGRLAVDLRFRGRGLGVVLLRDAFSRSVVAARSIGAAAITVHALDASAARFYARFGFNPMLDSTAGEMYLLMPVAEASILPSPEGQP